MTKAARAWERRQLLVEAQRLTSPRAGRFLDMGVALRVVERDPNGDYRIPSVPDQDARYRIVEVRHRGGMLDTLSRTWIGPSEDPVIWHCSREALPLITGSGPPGDLVLAAEGAGKSTLGAQWLVWNCALAYRSRRVRYGMTAPTLVRVDALLREIRAHSRPEWYEEYVEDQELVWRTGPTVQYRSTAIRSAMEGSPIQSFTWTGCLSDEWQDYAPSIEADIQTRGRGAIGGRYQRLVLCTPKATTQFRDRLAAKRIDPSWRISTFTGPANLFVAPLHWSNLRRTLSERDYRRRVLALDLLPEMALYPSMERARNVRELPHLGARDVTASVLRERWGIPYALLRCHDPGEIFHVTVDLRAYELAGIPGHSWWIVGETTTEREPIDSHIVAADQTLAKYGLTAPRKARDDDPRILVVGDPWIAGETHPDKSVAYAWRNAGYDCRAAAYQPGGQRPAMIKKEARIDLVDSLLGTGRLIVACDQYGQAYARRTLESLEQSERNEAGKPEAERKARDRLSHWSAAIGYGLWPHEKVMPVRRVG